MGAVSPAGRGNRTHHADDYTSVEHIKRYTTFGMGTDQRRAASRRLTGHRRARGPCGPPATASQDVAVVLHAVAGDTYDLYVMRSFAVSLWVWLVDTAAGVAAGRS